MVDGRGRARITDFGLAVARRRAAGRRGLRHAGVHGAGAARGQGRVGPERRLRARTRALRALHRPARVRRRDAPKELRRKHAEDPPTAPSALAPGFDPAVERVILRCLEKDPAIATGLRVARRGGAARRRSARRRARRRRDAVARDGRRRGRARRASRRPPHAACFSPSAAGLGARRLPDAAGRHRQVLVGTGEVARDPARTRPRDPAGSRTRRQARRLRELASVTDRRLPRTGLGRSRRARRRSFPRLRSASSYRQSPAAAVPAQRRQRSVSDTEGD